MITGNNIKALDPRNFRRVILASRFHDYVYLAIAKSASSTIKDILKSKEGYGHEQRLNEIHSRKNGPWYEYEELIDDPSLLKECLENKYVFTFVRNPYVRVLSAFLDRFFSDTNAARNFLSEHSLPYNSELSFLEFLTIIKDDPLELLDFHWTPQFFLLFDGHIQLDRVGYLENFNDDFMYIRKEINFRSETEDNSFWNFSPHQTKSSEKIIKYYNDKCIELVANIYDKDFKYFGYDKNINNLLPLGRKKKTGEKENKLSASLITYIEAKEKIKKHQYEESKLLLESLSPFKAPSFLHIELHRLEYYLGNLESAEKHLQNAVKQSPNDFTLRLHYGNFLLKGNNVLAAKEQVLAGLKLRPNEWSLNSLMARLLTREGNYTAAVRYFDACQASGKSPVLRKHDIEVGHQESRKKLLLSIDQRQHPVNSLIGGVASFFKRKEIFKITVNSILPQLDHLYVYLNNYKEIPDYLIDPKITVFRSEEFEDLSANGKVFCLNNLKSCYFFSLDDDIQYPHNYVRTMIDSLKKYRNKVAVSVHGSIFPEKVTWYFERYSLFPFQRELEKDKFVTLIGSGTFAFHTDTLRAKFEDFYSDVMVDLNFSILARKQKVPLVCIARPKMWLKALVQGEGLYQNFLKMDTIHTKIAKKCNPWSFAEYCDFIIPFINETFSDCTKSDLIEKNVDIDFIEAYESGNIPSSWRESDLYNKKRKDGTILANPIGSYYKLEREKNQCIRERNKYLRERDKYLRERDNLINSPSFQIGRKIVSAIKKPGKHTFLLPYDLIRIASGKKSNISD